MKYDETKIVPETAREYEKRELHSEKFPYNLYLTHGGLKDTSRHEVEVCELTKCLQQEYLISLDDLFHRIPYSS